MSPPLHPVDFLPQSYDSAGHGGVALRPAGPRGNSTQPKRVLQHKSNACSLYERPGVNRVDRKAL